MDYNNLHRLTLYHGSNRKFNAFKIQPYHRVGAGLGFGIYLTDDSARALLYSDGGYLYTVKANLLKPISTQTLTVPTAKLIELCVQYEDYPDIIANWFEPATSQVDLKAQCIDVAKLLCQTNTNDLDLINDLGNQVGGNDSAAELLTPILKQLGFNYVKKDHEYVFFDVNDLQIESRKKL